MRGIRVQTAGLRWLEQRRDRRKGDRRDGDGWLVRIRLTDPDETGTLLDVDAYKQVVAES